MTHPEIILPDEERPSPLRRMLRRLDRWLMSPPPVRRPTPTGDRP